MAYEFVPAEQEAQQAFELAWPGTEAGYYLEIFRQHIDEHGPGSFMVLKVGGGVIESDDALEDLNINVKMLHEMGLRPIIVHGGGTQITRSLEAIGIPRQDVAGIRYTPPEALPALADTLNQVNIDAALSMAADGIPVQRLHGYILAEHKDRELYGEVGEAVGIDAFAVESIHAALHQHRVPIISCLGRLASSSAENPQWLNVNADTAASAVAREFNPLKFMSITPPGGVLGKDGAIVRVITPEGAGQLIRDGVIDGGMRHKVEEEIKLVSEGVVADASVVSAKYIWLELVTHEGHGTLIANMPELRHYGRAEFDAINLRFLRTMIEDAFNEGREPARHVALAPEYFDSADLHKIIITRQSHDGVGILQLPNDRFLQAKNIMYLDKLAVHALARGRGVALQILEEASRHNGLFWRASTDHPHVKRYLDFADGEQRVKNRSGKEWHVFWKNVPDSKRIRRHIVKYARNKEETLLPANNEAAA